MVISANGEQQAWVMEKEIHGVEVGVAILYKVAREGFFS